MIDLKQVVSGITLSKMCSVSPDEDSDESKKINLVVKFDGVTLGDVFAKAMSPTVISGQAVLRKKFDTLKDGQTVTVNFKAPGITQIDPVDAVLASAKAEGMTPEDYILKEIAKRQATAEPAAITSRETVAGIEAKAKAKGK